MLSQQDETIELIENLLNRLKRSRDQGKVYDNWFNNMEQRIINIERKMEEINKAIIG